MSLRTQLKQAWDALAYADAGEFLPYAEKCRVLGVEPPKGCRGLLPPLERSTSRQLALGITKGFHLAQARYAIETAQRLGADLVLLLDGSQSHESPLKQVAELCAQAQIEVKHQLLQAPWIDSVARFLRSQPSVICLVLGPDSLEAQGLNIPAKKTFATPVVVVPGQAPLAPAC